MNTNSSISSLHNHRLILQREEQREEQQEERKKEEQEEQSELHGESGRSRSK